MKTAAKLVGALAALAATALTILAPAGAAASCGVRSVSQPFLPWLDPSHYFLAPGGDFESGSSGWSLGGGARVVAGNEPFHAHNAADSRSLLIPSGGWARSSSLCVDQDEPTMRFFVRSTGSPLSLLAVEARVRTTVLGMTTESTLPLGVVPGTSLTWQPSLPVVFNLSLNQILGGTTTVDFRFRPLGLGGEWQIDDVFVDPFKDRAPS